MRRSWGSRLVGGVLVLIAGVGPVAAGPWRVTVKGGGSGETVPVVAEIRGDVPPGNYRLRPEGGGPFIRAQVWSDAGARFLGTVLNASPGRTSRTFTLEPEGGSGKRSAGVEFREDGPNLAVFVGGKLLTVHHSDGPTKPFDHPLIGPTGASITRAYPMRRDVAGEDRDHPHQRSLWFSHGQVNGLDFWASDPLNRPSPRFGAIRETSRKVVASGASVGLLKTSDDWLGPDGKAVCRDERVLRFYDTGGPVIFDFDVRIRADDGPVTFGDTKEGTFGLRVASSMDVTKRKGGKITNAEGVTDDDAWGKASAWVDYSGPVDGKTVGVAVMNHPESFRHPTTWHVRGYGLFAANPFGWHDFGRKTRGDHTIPKGESIRFRYRVILHEGDTASARLPEAYRAYADPPTIEVLGE